MALINCPECKKEISDKAQSCPHCGVPVFQHDTESSVPINKSAQPKAKPKKKNGCLWILVLLLAGLAVFISKLTSDYNPNTRSALAKAMDLDESQEEKVLAIFEDCEIPDVKSASLFQEGETRTSYHLSCTDVPSRVVVWITNETKEIDEIYYNDYDIFVGSEVVNKLSSFYMTGEIKSGFRVIVENLMEDILTSPSTAKYAKSSDWTYTRIFEEYIIAGYVDSQNAFGATIRTDFRFTFEGDKITSLVLNGEEQL